MTTVIRAKHYDDTVQALIKDPIITAMASVIPDCVDLEDGNVMQAALGEYRRRGGKISSHIGGPIEAIRAIKAAQTTQDNE